MYLIQLGPVVYEGFKDGRPFSLVDALREVHGTLNAHILRMDGTPAVRHAGSSYLVHVPRNDRKKNAGIYRRKVKK